MVPRRASAFSRISIQSFFFRGNDLCRAYFAAFGLGSHGASDCRIGENHRGVCGTRVVEGEAIPLIGFLVESHRVRGCRTGGAKRDRDLSSAPFPGEICASLAPCVSWGQMPSGLSCSVLGRREWPVPVCVHTWTCTCACGRSWVCAHACPWYPTCVKPG